MKPRKPTHDPQDDLFKVRLIDLIDQTHPLVRLAQVIDWELLDKELSQFFEDRAGATALPTRLIAGLLYIQHAENLSDERLIERWVESPYWQYFCGEVFFQHQRSCHPTSLTRWRHYLGEAGCEWLLAETINAALRLKAIRPESLKRVIVDTTVQEKNITYPTDSKLYANMRGKLVALAHDLGLTLRQTYQKAYGELVPKVARYAHAKQYKRMRKALKQLKGLLGRVFRDIYRQVAQLGLELTEAQQVILQQAERLLLQGRNSKNKLYSLHEPGVDCISKGKAHKRYEFGVKVSVAVTAKESFVVGTRSYPGAPYDGHTLQDQLQQVETLTGQTVEHCYVDRGYRGHGVKGTTVYLAGQKRIAKREKRWLKRRNSVEPIIGHMKSDGKMGRCFLKGVLGDAINALLCACGQNIRKLLRWIMKLPYFLRFYWLIMLWLMRYGRTQQASLATSELT